MTIRRIFGRRAAGLAAVLSAGALALSACAGGGAGSTTDAAASGAAGSGEGIKVGVAMPTQTSERWIADGNAVKEGLEKAGYVVDLQYANDDIPTQTQQIDQMITNGAKILVIASIDGTALSSQLDAAGAANIPVVSYDRLIRDNENVDFYVSFDNYKVGVAQAKALLFGLGLTDKDGNKAADAPKGPLNIELFAGSPDDNNAGFFFNGAMDTLKPFVEDGTLVVKSGQTAFDQVATLRWSQEAAQKRMEDILTSTYGGGSPSPASSRPSTASPAASSPPSRARATARRSKMACRSSPARMPRSHRSSSSTTAFSSPRSSRTPASWPSRP